MAVGAFPLVKLGALAIRQIAKPIANVLKTRAKNSPFFRNYVCMPPAQLYHYFEVNVKMKMLGLGKPSNVKKLNETAAIELGAELLGESIIFFIAVLTLSAEYYRQSKKAEKEAAQLEERWTGVENRIQELEFLTEKQRAEIRELTRLVYANQPRTKVPSPPAPSTPVAGSPAKSTASSSSTPSKQPLSGAIEETLQKLNVPK